MQGLKLNRKKVGGAGLIIIVGKIGGAGLIIILEKGRRCRAYNYIWKRYEVQGLLL